MSRWRRSASNALAASSFGLLAMLFGSSAGCEFLSRVDRSDIAQNGGNGGTGGEGGGAGCTTAEDCPGTDTVCRSRSCTANVCGFVDAPAGTATGNDTAGDCLREVCDGQGTVTTEPDDMDILDDNKDCTTDLCANGKPQNTPLGAGATCTSNGGKVCDGNGTCVECSGPEHCTTSVCTANSCVPAACIDTVKNGTETDIDCGGADCTGCDDGKICVVAADCTSKVCTQGVCQIPTCTDTIENGTESDIDCGGSCSPCGPGLGCSQDSDCIGSSCSGSVCLESCTDNIKNANETDIDCGGPTCSPCADSEVCSVNSDCASKVCMGGVCIAAMCADSVKNGAETGIDCGGGSCPTCADGGGCTVASDCNSGVCMGMVCQAATCSDTVKNGAESDIDCGGGTCTACVLGKACGQNSDCSSNICVNNVCVDALCGDGLVTGSEACDDGNALSNDGCSAMCTPESGYTCSMGMPSVCTPNCNDNVVVPGEACDDGNATNGDGCSATCAVEVGYGCTGSPSTCSSVCGDGVAILTETCDDGNIFGGDGCSTSCTLEAGFNCSGTPSACTAICGDGKLVGFEECDDGNTVNGDGCNNTCYTEPSYGCAGEPSVCYPLELEPNGGCATASGPFAVPFVLNGRITPAADEDYIKISIPAHADLRIQTWAPTLGQCLTGNDTVIELRGTDCTTVLVSDDDGGTSPCSKIDSTVAGYGAAKNMAPGVYYVRVRHYNTTSTIPAYKLEVKYNALCGNGITEGSETCDDGNLVAGDGCATNCRIEPKPEVEPNDTCAQAPMPYTAPVLVGGSITPGTDKDLFAFTIPAYADIKVQTFAPNYDVCPTGTDTILQLRGTNCSTILATNDNGGVGTCSLIDSATNPAAVNLPPGTYYVQVEENGNNATIPAYQVLIGINALCGDGVKQGSETCDDGNSISNDGCANNCRLEQGWTCTGAPSVCTFDCGNGMVTGTETCDDGNMTSGDGCSSLCIIEPGYICSGAPSMCMFTCGNGVVDGADQCDDGNANAGDGCTAGCQVELSYNCSGTPSVCTKFESLCNDNMDGDMDGLIDSADPDCQIPGYFPACAMGQSLRVFKSTNVPQAIPDSPNTTGVTSNLIIGPGAGTVNRAAMLYNITHTWDADLDLTLIPPTAVNMDICSDNGGSSPNYTNTVLDSTCASAVTAGAAPFSGCYQPETSFASLAGVAPTGIWKFKAVDDAGGDTGTINSWAMIFCTTP